MSMHDVHVSKATNLQALSWIHTELTSVTAAWAAVAKNMMIDQ